MVCPCLESATAREPAWCSCSAQQGRLSTWIQQFNGKPLHDDVGGALHHVIHTAVCNCRNPRGKASPTVVDGVGRTQFPGKFQPATMDVHRDNGLGPDNARGHHRSQADRADAKNGEAGSGPNSQRVHHRADSGLQAATQGRQQLQWKHSGHFHYIAHRCQGVCGKRGLAANRQGAPLLPGHGAEVGLARDHRQSMGIGRPCAYRGRGILSLLAPRALSVRRQVREPQHGGVNHAQNRPAIVHHRHIDRELWSSLAQFKAPSDPARTASSPQHGGHCG